jgi:choline kinase
VIKENRINEFYEASFLELIKNGDDIYAVDIGLSKAAEVDFPEDLEAAKKDIIPFI